MISFAQLLEQLEKQKESTPLMTSGEDGPALVVVKSGKNLHDDGQTSFWDEFISLCGNSEGVADLLGVSREKVNSWPARIKEQLDKIQQNGADPQEDQDTKVVPTGETGALTTNQDPNLGGIL